MYTHSRSCVGSPRKGRTWAKKKLASRVTGYQPVIEREHYVPSAYWTPSNFRPPRNRLSSATAGLSICLAEILWNALWASCGSADHSENLKSSPQGRANGVSDRPEGLIKGLLSTAWSGEDLGVQEKDPIKRLRQRPETRNRRGQGSWRLLLAWPWFSVLYLPWQWRQLSCGDVWPLGRPRDSSALRPDSVVSIARHPGSAARPRLNPSPRKRSICGDPLTSQTHSPCYNCSVAKSVRRD